MKARAQATHVGRRIYRNPPVHEVVFDLQFAGELPAAAIQAVPQRLGETFGQSRPITRVANYVLLGSSAGLVTRPPESTSWGWEFVEEEGPRRITRISPNQVTQHFLRSEGWPAGPYSGWEENASRFGRLLSLTEDTFQDLPIRRAGLRYVNRVAVPKDSTLEEWFRVVPSPLPDFTTLWEFSISRTWQQSPDFPGLSGTVTLSMSDHAPPSTGDEEDRDELGVILDIDIFNLWVRDAPKWWDVEQWMERAHSLEHRVFRSCITEALEKRFGILEDV